MAVGAIIVMLLNPIRLVCCNKFIFDFELKCNWKDVLIFLFLSYVLIHNSIANCTQTVDFYNAANLAIVMITYLS